MPMAITQTMAPSAVTASAEDTKKDLVNQHRQSTYGSFQAIARGNRSGSLKLQGIPEFTDLYEKRQWMKGHMAAAFRFFGKQGYGEGISGHISIRGTSTTEQGSPSIKAVSSA
jgi:hypothetical protein